MAAARRQRAGLAVREHRALPAGPWVMGQTWQDLLFAHWPLPVEVIRAAVPQALEVDTFEGQAWLGITPFVVTDLRPRGMPGLMRFPELNVRTYVSRDGRPGIWFFTLEAASRLAVAGARALYRLPYHHSHMRADDTDGWIEYRCERPGAVFDARYRPTGDAAAAAPGSLAHWLTERYRLYTGRWGADIHHVPWPLQPAEAEIRVNSMGGGLPIDPPRPAQLHFARRLDVVVWPLRRT